VAREILEIPDAVLEVVLPLAREEYLKDFSDPGSRSEFEALAARAQRIRQLPPSATRSHGYAEAGRYVVDHCNLLIALWNGKPATGEGGTAEIVRYARTRGCPLFWIRTDDPSHVAFEKGANFSLEAYRDLDIYNTEALDVDAHRAEEEKLRSRLSGLAGDLALPMDCLRPAIARLIPHFVRADRLANHYQQLHLRAGMLVYGLAAAACAVAAFQAIFLPLLVRIVLLEVALVAIVLGIFWIGTGRHWHEKWIDYRFLAERFRSAIFMSAAGVEVATLRPPRHLSLSHTSKDWMVAAFVSVWRNLQKPPECDDEGFRKLREFISRGWVEEQRIYHERNSRKNAQRHCWMANSCYALFWLTFFAAVLHSLHLGGERFGPVLSFVAVVFPVIGGAIGAMRMHREYHRNSQRSAEMARHLTELKGEIDAVQDMKALLQLVRETEETMLHENEDWRVIFRFHRLEPVG
jgi:hypothetical protein